MCRYDLPVCPHPHQDPVINLIYNPAKQSEWQACDLPRPWGRLSCGKLAIAHPLFGVPQKCSWCSLALYASISKFKTAQEEYKKKLQDLGQLMRDDAKLSKLDAEIAIKEMELEELQEAAWQQRNAIFQDPKGEDNKCNVVEMEVSQVK